MDGRCGLGPAVLTSPPFGTRPLDPAEAGAVLADGAYGLRVRAEDDRMCLVGDGAGTGLPLGRYPDWSDLYRALIRLRRTRQRRDPEWLRNLSRALETAAGTEPPPGPPSSDRQRFSAAVADDPLLRMHCATRSGNAPDPDPPHPQYPGGTIAVSVDALTEPSSALPRGLLHQVLRNRFERRENELGYFLEHFIRPPLRAFRLALDRHRTALLSLRGSGIGYELSCELQPTGRIVVTEQASAFDSAAARREGGATGSGGHDSGIRDGVHALLGTLDALSAAFCAARIDGGPRPDTRVRGAVDRVIAEELRDLEPHTAEALSGPHPLQCFVHTVPPEQDEVLKRVLHEVQERARRNRWEPRRPAPTVVIDVDLCALVPLQRTLDAARAVSGPRAGAPDGIGELASPWSLAVLPAYERSTWRNFLAHNGLGARYPAVDWQRVRTEFHRCFARPQQKLRTDSVNAGLARFVWDVRDAGGRVVFCTGRRERLREYTEEVLHAAGVPEVELLCMPDDRSRAVSELKVERLRELGHVDVVAVFDDMLANRIAVTKEFTDALAVAVELPGVATERQPEQPLVDEAPVIATFETSPRRRTARRTPALSDTHSLEELQVSELRDNRSAHRWGVRLTRRETLSIMNSVVADADRSAERTAGNARARFGIPGPRTPDEDEQRERTVLALHHLFTRKQFLKGSRSNYRPDDVRRDVAGFLRRSQPVEVVLLGFPIKQCLNRLKAFGPLPDLAEFGALVRLRELQHAVRCVYPPGLHFNILTDGRHFRPRPPSATGAYSGKLREYAELAGIDGYTSITEIDQLARQRLGPDLPAERAALFDRHRRMLGDALRGFDVTDDPLRTLDTVSRMAAGTDGPDAEALARSLGMFREILMSTVYSVPVPVPGGVERLAWSRLVYADLYNLTDAGVSPEVRQARAAVLRRAWHNVIRYLATLRVDEALDYDDLIPQRVRLTVNAVTPGRCGFTYLGGSGLLPWQGTGVLDGRGNVAADFAVALLDQGFVPAYSPVLGPRQPWMMVPAQHTRVPGSGAGGFDVGDGQGGALLDEDFAARARLRRR